MSFSHYIARLLLTLGIFACAMPAFAAGVDKVRFQVKPKAVVKALPKIKNGQKRFLVASNAPFKIISKNVIGKVKVRIKRKGKTLKHGFKFGQAAQHPGRVKSCRSVTSFLPTTIYTAERRTALFEEELQAQAVLVTIEFSKLASPDFQIVSQSGQLAPKARKVDCQ